MKSYLTLFFFVVVITSAFSQEKDEAVYIRVGSEEGLGLLRSKNGEAYVICPNHVVSGPGDAIQVFTKDGTQFEAEFKYAALPVSVLKITSDTKFLKASRWARQLSYSQIKTLVSAQPSLTLLKTEPAGGQTFVSITSTEISLIQESVINFRYGVDTEMHKGMSGSLLVSGDKILGLLDKVDFSGRRASIIPMSVVFAVTARYFPETENLVALDERSGNKVYLSNAAEFEPGEKVVALNNRHSIQSLAGFLFIDEVSKTQSTAKARIGYTFEQITKETTFKAAQFSKLRGAFSVDYCQMFNGPNRLGITSFGGSLYSMRSGLGVYYAFSLFDFQIDQSTVVQIDHGVSFAGMYNFGISPNVKFTTHLGIYADMEASTVSPYGDFLCRVNLSSFSFLIGPRAIVNGPRIAEYYYQPIYIEFSSIGLFAQLQYTLNNKRYSLK